MSFAFTGDFSTPPQGNRRRINWNVLIGLTQQNDKLEFVEESQSIEQHCHSEPVRTTFVGISIEFRAAHRHTDCSILLFSEILPREIVLLSRRLPRQFANWLAMTGNSIARQIVYLLSKTDMHKLEFAEESRASNNTVIPNQSADWCGNLHRIPGSLSSFRLSFLCRFPEFVHEKWYF